MSRVYCANGKQYLYPQVIAYWSANRKGCFLEETLISVLGGGGDDGGAAAPAGHHAAGTDSGDSGVAGFPDLFPASDATANTTPSDFRKRSRGLVESASPDSSVRRVP